MNYTKIKLFLLIFPFLFLTGIEVKAQQSSLLPLEIRQAYQSGTRSMTGKPGPFYWQNRAKYKIHAELVSEEKKIYGEETITYFNNSPDTLSEIVIRLYPDLFMKGNSRDWSLGPEAMNEGTIIDYLKINGKDIDLNNRRLAYRYTTNLYIELLELLPPAESMVIELKWVFQIPSVRPIRTGYYGNDVFFVAYWYPQIAVYDDIDGWDKLEYRGTVEFYNDFNDYDVYLKVPDGFKVWATGTLQNKNELYTKKVLKKLEKARNSEKVVSIFTVKDCMENIVLADSESNTWHFKANQVPDFSFGAAKDVNWDGSSLKVDHLTSRKVFVDAVYADSARTYDTAALWTRQSVEYLSFEMPAYPFPYQHMTTFSNNRKGGGMETPMMANNGDPYVAPDAAATVFHEIAHTYFPFYMGTNERKYAWMDEGWAVFLPVGFMEKYYPKWNYAKRSVEAFEHINGKEKEATLMTLSYKLGGTRSYRYHAYNRPAIAYMLLHDALGDSTFKVALHAFINNWNGKHPTPYDFFNTFSSASGQQLDWFFIPWFFEKAQADLGIKKATVDNKIVVENIGGLPIPINLMVAYDDESIDYFYENTSVWQYSETAVVVQANPEKKISWIKLGSDKIPDINKNNNELLIVDD